MVVSSRTALTVAVLMGGPSAERQVSLVSGRKCVSALRSAGYNVVAIDADEQLPLRLDEARPDVVFNALHGRWGEDGCVQGILEWLGLAYTHSGVAASALAMDKARSKTIYRAAGLPIAPSVLAQRDSVCTAHVMPPPYVVKPINEGSSVGVHIVPAHANRPPQLSADAPAIVMVEQFVPGRELTCSVMGARPLAVTDIITNGWYDYDAKYTPGGSRHDIPARIPQPIYDACMDYALRAHQALGCKGVSRSDFRWDEEKGLEGLRILETNTQPGMTPTSLTPEQANHQGIDFVGLCDWMVKDASCSR